MKLWFIRHKFTGHYIPQPEGRNGRGGSHLEPWPDSNKARIFRSERSAKIFLSSWLRGKVIREAGYSPGHPGNDWEADYWDELSTICVPSRVREDMEIIEKEIIL